MSFNTAIHKSREKKISEENPWQAIFGQEAESVRAVAMEFERLFAQKRAVVSALARDGHNQALLANLQQKTAAIEAFCAGKHQQALDKYFNWLLEQFNT